MCVEGKTKDRDWERGVLRTCLDKAHINDLGRETGTGWQGLMELKWDSIIRELD